MYNAKQNNSDTMDEADIQNYITLTSHDIS